LACRRTRQDTARAGDMAAVPSDALEFLQKKAPNPRRRYAGPIFM